MRTPKCAVATDYTAVGGKLLARDAFAVAAGVAAARAAKLARHPIYCASPTYVASVSNTTTPETVFA